MKSQYKKIIQQKILKLPDSPGVYIFKSKRQKAKSKSEILYIGKATSLRDRVKSYMSKTVFDTRSPLIHKMLEHFDDIKYIKTDSVLEALILEANLIKKYQPEANIKEKDNRSFNFVVITEENYPRVLVMRGKELLKSNLSQDSSLTIYRKRSNGTAIKIANSFGPFPNSGQLKEALKIIRKMFPYRDKCIPFSAKPCFNRQIGLCPGVCTSEITKEEYKKQIRNIILFFQGNKKCLLKNLEKQMKSFAKAQKFEKANHTKHILFSLNHIQDVALIKEEYRIDPVVDFGMAESTLRQRRNAKIHYRIESYDVAHMSGQNVVGVMTVVEDGEVKKSDYRMFRIRNKPSLRQPARLFQSGTGGGYGGHSDTKALSEILSCRLAHIEWPFPDLIVVDGGLAQKRVMEKVLKENHRNIPIVSVVKDEYHRPKQILGDRKWPQYEREIILANSESHRFGIGYHRKLRGKIV